MAFGKKKDKPELPDLDKANKAAEEWRQKGIAVAKAKGLGGRQPKPGE